MMLEAKLAAKTGIDPQHFDRLRLVTARAGRHKILQRGKLIPRAVSAEPIRYLFVAMQRSQRVRGATVAAWLMNIRAVTDQQLYHRNTASLRCDMQGGIPRFGPREVGIRA